MKGNSLTKFVILILASTLASACDVHEITPSSSQKNIDSSSSESASESDSTSSFIEEELGNYNANPILKNYRLQSNNKTCDNHQPKEVIMWKASILSKGVKRFTCANCGGFNEQFYYDLDEVAFESKAFAYDGKERTLTIEGIVPHDVTVRYSNNTLTEKIS